jgi:MOSC domain-containing protein YiiM
MAEQDISRQGRIFQLNISPGGVPKRAVQQATLSAFGLDGDDHYDQKHHGGPDRALCLYSLEHILALQAEGHPVFPGALGENITTSGVDLSGLRPGDRLELGPDVLIEVTSYTTPCRTIQGSFRAHNFARILQGQNPGWSRLYARVLQPGLLRVGLPVRVQGVEARD